MACEGDDEWVEMRMHFDRVVTDLKEYHIGVFYFCVLLFFSSNEKYMLIIGFYLLKVISNFNFYWKKIYLLSFLLTYLELTKVLENKEWKTMKKLKNTNFSYLYEANLRFILFCESFTRSIPKQFHDSNYGLLFQHSSIAPSKRQQNWRIS